MNEREDRVDAPSASIPDPGEVFPRVTLSGLYESKAPLLPRGPEFPGPPEWAVKGELRLDVDRYYPQMVASGIIHAAPHSRMHWVADLVAAGEDTWTGSIWYKAGTPSFFPYTTLEIHVTRTSPYSRPSAAVTFSGGGGPTQVRTFSYASPYFHAVDFEFDSAEGETVTTTVDTCAHPNHAATLRCETLSIPRVFTRAGFEVTTSPAGSVPLEGAGSDALWSDGEMHDAMQVYWSRFEARAQWALWVFFASLHEPYFGWPPEDLGGIMFDQIGPNHRQGTAIFKDSFISEPPPDDPEPKAWVRRMLFWRIASSGGSAAAIAPGGGFLDLDVLRRPRTISDFLVRRAPRGLHWRGSGGGAQCHEQSV